MNHPIATSWNYVRAAFQKIWGYDDFRPPQGEIIRSLLAQRDALSIMPTGSGKFICFQLPAFGGVDGKSGTGIARSPSTSCSFAW